MCLISKHKVKEKIKFLKKGETYVSPQKHKFKNIIICFIKVGHVAKLEKVRNDTIFCNQE